MITDKCHTIRFAVIDNSFRNDHITAILVAIAIMIISTIRYSQLLTIVNVIVVDGYTICICHFNVVGECLNSYHAHEHGEEKCNV